MKELWVEKYRPKSLDEVVGQEEIVERLKAYAKTGNLPHLLFAGPAGFRVRPLKRDAIAEYIGRIAKSEKLKITDDGLEALVYVAEGDMRRAVNALQVAASLGSTVDAEVLYKVSSTVRPEEVKGLI